MGGFLLARISGMVRERMIERGAIDILRVRRQMVADCRRKVSVGRVRHWPISSLATVSDKETVP